MFQYGYNHQPVYIYITPHLAILVSITNLSLSYVIYKQTLRFHTAAPPFSELLTSGEFSPWPRPKLSAHTERCLPPPAVRRRVRTQMQPMDGWLTSESMTWWKNLEELYLDPPNTPKTMVKVWKKNPGLKARFPHLSGEGWLDFMSAGPPPSPAPPAPPPDLNCKR